MKLELFDRTIEVFSISPRTLNAQEYWVNIDKTIELSEKYNYSGILLFTGHDTYVEPWMIANIVLSRTKRLAPLIAVNPIYMHPFTVAKNINSLAYLYDRKIFVNCVTVTAKVDLVAFNDELNHDERYDRLVDYFSLVRSLLESSEPISYNGKFYSVKNIHLRPKIDNHLLPEYFLAGFSAGAETSSHKIGATWMNMAYPVKANLEGVLEEKNKKEFI